MGGGFEVTTGCAAFEFDVVAVAHGLSSSSTTTWESICFDSSLAFGVSVPSSSLLLSLPCSSAWVFNLGVLGQQDSVSTFERGIL